MEKDDAARIVQEYIGLPSPPPLHGWGIGGFIFVTPDKTAAIKVYRRVEGFTTELKVVKGVSKISEDGSDQLAWVNNSKNEALPR